MSPHPRQERLVRAKEHPKQSEHSNQPELCPQCGETIGRNYPDCATCFRVVEAIWASEWYALLEAECESDDLPDDWRIQGRPPLVIAA